MSWVRASKPSRPAVHVARGATYIIISTVLGSVISVLAFGVIARLISRIEMGELAVLSFVATGAQLLAGLGVGSTATRFVASFDGSDDHESMQKVGYECLILVASGAAILMVGIFLSADLLASSLFGSVAKSVLLRLLLPEIGALSLSYSLTSILYGLKKFKEVSVTNTASFAVRQALVVVFLLLGWGLPGVVVAWGIGDSINATILSAYLVKFFGPPKVGLGFRKLLIFSGPLFLGEAAGYAWTWFDRALLIPLVSLGQLGSYNVAVTAFAVLNSIPQALSGTLFPFYSNIYSKPDQEIKDNLVELGNAVKTASRYVSFLTIPVAVGLAVTARPATTLLAGSIYQDAALPLAIMAISLALVCQARALGAIFVVLGKNVTSALVTIGSVVLPVLLGIIIIPFLGVVGASLLRGISLLLSLGLSMLILRRILRLRFDMSAYVRSWIASLVMAGIVLVVEFLYYNPRLLPLYMVLGASVFLIVLKLLKAVTREDLDLISDFAGQRFRPLTKLLEIYLIENTESS